MTNRPKIRGGKEIPKIINRYNHNTPTSLENVIDIDGNIYEAVTIGNQRWLTSNLQVTHFNNGDEIYERFDYYDPWCEDYPVDSYWACWGMYDVPEYSIFYDALGFHYNWRVVQDRRGVCPEGWHVPSMNEWYELLVTLDPEGTCIDPEDAGGCGGWHMRSLSAGPAMKEDCNPSPCGNDECCWDEEPEGEYEWEPPTNESGLSILPNGYRYHTDSWNHCNWCSVSRHAYIWSLDPVHHYTSGQYDEYDNYIANYIKLYKTADMVIMAPITVHSGMAIRCMKNLSCPPHIDCPRGQMWDESICSCINAFG